MKILLVCAGGVSTGILTKKMEKHWAEQGQDLEIKAAGLSSYEEKSKDYEIVLVGPQVAYRIFEIREKTQLPTAAIQSFDYAVGNVEKIMALAEKLYQERDQKEESTDGKNTAK